MCNFFHLKHSIIPSISLVKDKCEIWVKLVSRKDGVYMNFSEKLMKLRKEKGLTQDDVAKAVGTTRRTYISYESEGRYPRKREIYAKLADVLGCSADYLVTEDEEFITQAGEQYGSRGRRQAEELVAELSGMFAGGELSDADKDAVMLALQKAYWDCKEDNKKYTPKKYRSESEE